METISEIIPFAKEVFSQGPSRGMVKIYLLGTTLALFGVVGGIVETVCLPFLEQEPIERIAEMPEEKEEKEEKKQMLKPKTASVEPDAVKIVETTENGAKAKHLVTAGQRSMANRRSHAS